MPAYVGFSAIDWHYDRAAGDLQEALRVANLALASSSHTYETFVETLHAFASERPDAVADALLEDGYRLLYLFELRNGRVGEELVFDENLPWDSVIGTNDGWMTLEYETEDQMRAAAKAAAKDGGTGACVAAVGERRFHVKIGKRLTIKELTPEIDRDLYARLYRRDFVVPPLPSLSSDEKYEQPVTIAKAAFDFLQDVAVRTDRSLSNICQTAWKLARDTIATANHDAIRQATGAFDGAPGTLRLYFTGAMIEDINTQSARLEVPLSTAVVAALAIAKPQIETLPPLP